MKFELNFEEGCLMPSDINFKKPREVKRLFEDINTIELYFALIRPTGGFKMKYVFKIFSLIKAFDLHFNRRLYNLSVNDGFSFSDYVLEILN